jgi:pimeloyl-ACP methyl ester carboxylesterase
MATVVLVHGAWAGGWVWRDVADRLRAAGHQVYTPTLTGLGERSHLASPAIDLATHVSDVANVVIYEDLAEVVLAGHSYGGMVITGVAERIPERLAQLVYVDAYVPFSGESLLDLVSPAARAILEEQFRTGGDGWRHPGLGGTTQRHSPHPWRTFTEPLAVDNPAAAALVRSYLRHTADKGPDDFMGLCFAASFARARSAGWTVRELAIDHGVRANAEPVAAALLDLIGIERRSERSTT